MTVYWEVCVERRQIAAFYVMADTFEQASAEADAGIGETGIEPDEWQPVTTEIYAVRRRLSDLDGDTPVLTGEGWRLPHELGEEAT